MKTSHKSDELKNKKGGGPQIGTYCDHELIFSREVVHNDDAIFF